MRTSWAGLWAMALTIWLGLHAIRTSLAMVVWNIGEERAPTQLVLIVLAIWSFGLLSAPWAGRFGGTRAVERLAGIFGATVVLYALVIHPTLTPFLGEVMIVTWLWYLPALIFALGRAGLAHDIAAGAAVGVAAQVALQHALHGMDLPMLHGASVGVGAAVLTGMLLVSARTLSNRIHQRPGVQPGWGLLALGPFLTLEMTLLSNLGRVQLLGSVSPPRAAGVILSGVIVGSALLGARLRRPALTAAALAAAGLLARPEWLQGSGVWLVALIQALLVAVLGAAFAPTGSHRPGRVYASITGTMLLMLLLVFLFYSRYGWPLLWPIMAILVALPLGRRSMLYPSPRVSVAGVAAMLIGGLGIGAHTATTQRAFDGSSAQTPAAVTVLTYNIHMAFDAHSLPDPEALARVIAASDAHLVALQEVGRGWTVNGGVDLAQWLQWRLPQYRLVYGPMNGDLWGNAIMSRLPVAASGSVRFPIRASAFQRGLVWARVAGPVGGVLVISTHLSAFDQYAEDRLAQAQDLLQFWHGQSPAIIAGDFNATPDSPIIQHLQAAGLRDVTIPLGLGMTPTYSTRDPHERIDYIFGTGIEALTASVPRVTASDHLPILVTVRLP